MGQVVIIQAHMTMGQLDIFKATGKTNGSTHKQFKIVN